jgi:hypothetical protein
MCTSCVEWYIDEQNIKLHQITYELEQEKVATMEIMNKIVQLTNSQFAHKQEIAQLKSDNGMIVLENIKLRQNRYKEIRENETGLRRRSELADESCEGEPGPTLLKKARLSTTAET